MRLTFACSVLTLICLAGCGSGPTRIDPKSDEKVTSMGVDYDEMIEWSDKLTQRMLADGFLDESEFGPRPVKMVVSTIENNTNLSNFPKESVLGRIRAKLRSSGKVRYVSTYGDDMRDKMPGDTGDAANDDRFDRKQLPKAEQWSVARLSLRTQILYASAFAGKSRQNTYEVRMAVTDVNNGEVVWEGFSDPIAKKSTKGTVGW